MQSSDQFIQPHQPTQSRAGGRSRRLRQTKSLSRHLLWMAASVGIGTGAGFAVGAEQPTASTTAPAAVATTNASGMNDIELKDAQVAMAQRLETAAYQVVQESERGQTSAAWQEAIAFLTAAERLNPAEPRYPRLRYDALTEIGDADGAAKALEKYLAMKPDDEVARLHLIEYFAAKMQTTDAKLSYLQSLLDKESISNTIKSQIAVWSAGLLGERSRTAQAAMVKRAVELDPFNVYARRLEYEELARGGANPVQRLQSLTAQLRANPAQVSVLAAIGEEMAAAAIVRPSLDWFNAAVNLADRIQQPLGRDFFLDYAAQLYLNGRPKDADTEIERLLTADIYNVDAWFLRLSMRKAQGQQVAYDREVDQAKAIFAARAGAVARRIQEQANPNGSATTQPTSRPADTGPSTKPFDFNAAFSAGGDSATNGTDTGNGGTREAAPTGQLLQETIDRLKKPDADRNLKADFLSTLIDLAWFECYYGRSSAAAQTWVDAVAALLPAESPTVVRLRGWRELLNNRKAEAMQILWPIRQTDPQAGMGVVQLLNSGNWAPKAAPGANQPAGKPPAFDPVVLAQKLVNEHPAGLMGAMLVADFSTLRNAKQEKVEPLAGEAGEQLKKVIDAFPIDFIRVVDQPERFYALSGRAQKTPCRLGEPIVVDVSIQNRTDYPLTVGVDGVIKPDLWFDARVALGRERLLAKVGHDRIAALVLPPRGVVTQAVRVDQGELWDTLWERPAGSVDIFFTVMTNPLLRQDGFVMAGPAGLRRAFEKSVIRGGMSILGEPDRRRLYSGLNGLPSEKMWTIDEMAALVMQSRGADNEPNVERHAPDFFASIGKMENDRVPQAGAWASYTLLKLEENAGVAQRPGVITTQMKRLVSNPAWEARMLAVWASTRLPAQQRKELLKPLASDSDDLVKQAATAELQLAEKGVGPASTTRPATPDATSQPAGPALQDAGGGPKLPLPGGN